MIRVLFKARDNGQEFPVYFNHESEIAEAAEKLKADPIKVMPGVPEELLLFEQIDALMKAGMKP